MRTDEEIDRLLLSWFDAGPTRAGDHVLDTLAARIGHQRQRPVWALVWRTVLTRQQWFELAAAGTAVVLVVAMALALQPRHPPSVGVGSTASPSGGATTERPDGSTEPSASASLAAPAGPGTYRSEQFPVRLTYTVPAGWWKSADDPTAITIITGETDDPTAVIELLYDAYPPLVDADGCQKSISWDRPHGVRDLLRYWESRPEIVVRERDRVSKGGLDGYRVVIAAPEGGCGDLGANAYVVHWYDGVPFTLGITDELELIALEDGSGRTLVLVVSVLGDDPAVRAEAEQIVQSFVFDDSPREG
jgi:hypothetical protein